MVKNLQRMYRSGVGLSIVTMALGIGLLAHNLIETKDKVVSLNKANHALLEEVNQKDVAISNYQAKVEKLDKRINRLSKNTADLTKQVNMYKKKEKARIQAEKKAKKAQELKQEIELKKKQQQRKVSSRASQKAPTKVTSSVPSQSFTMTNYTVNCTGCTGTTKSGKNVNNTIYHNGMRIVATDPSIIPLGSILEISVGGNAFKAQALDVGGAIKGYRLDLLVESNTEANSFGRKKVLVKIIRKGW